MSRLAKGQIKEVFVTVGGAEGMAEWCRRSPKNLYAFYVYILPKLIRAEIVDAAAERLAQRPAITRIESVIIDPKADWKETVTDEVP